MKLRSKRSIEYDVKVNLKRYSVLWLLIKKIVMYMFAVFIAMSTVLVMFVIYIICTLPSTTFIKGEIMVLQSYLLMFGVTYFLILLFGVFVNRYEFLLFQYDDDLFLENYPDRLETVIYGNYAFSKLERFLFNNGLLDISLSQSNLLKIEEFIADEKMYELVKAS